MTRERRLGRGLAALLGETEEAAGMGEVTRASTTPQFSGNGDVGSDSAAEVQAPTTGPNEGDMLLLNVQEIDDNPFQPRREFSESEIASLSESLKEHDMLQPILVRRVGGRWQLISGERRLRAAIRAGWSEVPARVRDADDRLVAELAIVENLQRKDLNPIEKALSFRRYLDQHECTQEDLAQRLKIDRSTIANLLRLLELPAGIQADLQTGSISAGHARALLPLGDEQQQIEFCLRISREGLSVRDIERLVQERIQLEDGDPLSLAGSGGKTKQKRTRSNHIASLEQRLRIALGTKVDIRPGNRGRGQIVIHFRGNEEFERLSRLVLEAGSDNVQSFVG